MTEAPKTNCSNSAVALVNLTGGLIAFEEAEEVCHLCALELHNLTLSPQ